MSLFWPPQSLPSSVALTLKTPLDVLYRFRATLYKVNKESTYHIDNHSCEKPGKAAVSARKLTSMAR